LAVEEYIQAFKPLTGRILRIFAVTPQTIIFMKRQRDGLRTHAQGLELKVKEIVKSWETACGG
jgi:hypothetical protein